MRLPALTFGFPSPWMIADFNAIYRKLLAHERVNVFYDLARKRASAYVRLISCDHQPKACSLQCVACFCGSREDVELAQICGWIRSAVPFQCAIDHSVTVQKNSPALSAPTVWAVAVHRVFSHFVLPVFSFG